MAAPIPLFKAAATRISEIIECERQADDHDAIADRFRWKAAELIAEELADGKTQRQLADEIGKSRIHVRLMQRVWSRFGHLGAQERPTFNDAYQQAKLAEAAADEQRRKTAVSYQTVIYNPAMLLAQLAGGQATPVQIAAHMRDYPHYTTASKEDLIAAGNLLLTLADAS